MKRINTLIVVPMVLAWSAGCATQKESHTARTGVEQLLISSAVDRSLDAVDYHAVRGKQVFLETKYLECVDKNYVIGSLRHRIVQNKGKLLEKADQADIIMEVSSGGVGTDNQELFVGIPEIPLPPPSPIAIPRLSMLTRKKMNGTAKLLVVAYDAKTKTPVIQSGPTLARSDFNNWNVLGFGPVESGSVTRELAEATREVEPSATNAIHHATNVFRGRTRTNAGGPREDDDAFIHANHKALTTIPATPAGPATPAAPLAMPAAPLAPPAMPAAPLAGPVTPPATPAAPPAPRAGPVTPPPLPVTSPVPAIPVALPVPALSPLPDLMPRSPAPALPAVWETPVMPVLPVMPAFPSHEVKARPR